MDGRKVLLGDDLGYRDLDSSDKCGVFHLLPISPSPAEAAGYQTLFLSAAALAACVMSLVGLNPVRLTATPSPLVCDASKKAKD